MTDTLKHPYGGALTADQRNFYHLFVGDSSNFSYHGLDLVDFVLTNPYAPLPKQLQSKPMLICDFSDRHKLAEERCGTSLSLVSAWYGGKNSIWAGNMPVKHVDLTDLNPEWKDGWFPLELPLRLLSYYAKPGMTIWDGFCGRGTVGLACKMLNMSFIGIDRDAARIDYAEKYINAVKNL